jgi:uncharacterized protein (DUF885 family)
MKRLRTAALFLLALSCAAPAGQRPVTGPAPTAEAAFQRASAELYQAYFDRIPAGVFGGSQAVALGMHQYDGKLPDDSPVALQGRAAFLAEARARLESFAAAELSVGSRFERDVFVVRLRGALFDLAVRRTPWRSPPYYLGALSLQNYTSRDYAPVDERARAVLAVCRAARRYLETARANLEASLPRPVVGFAIQMAGGQIAFVQKDVVEALSGVVDPALKADLTPALAELVAQLGAFRDDLKGRLARGTDDFALGEQSFLRMLEETEDLRIDLARLDSVGRADLARNQRALEAAARAFAPGKPLAEALAAAGADRPAAGELLGIARQQVGSLREFLGRHPIVTIPSDEQAEVRESPPFLRVNFASINQPGVFEKRPLPSFYFISPPDPKWSEAEQRAYVASREGLLFTTIHEVWPGHFLDRLHRVRLQSRITRSFGSYASNEGWAHYVEEMMWEEGVAGQDPRAHIAQLLQALMRDVRFLSAIGLHTHGMTVAESHKLFVEQAFQDPGTARQQSMRGTVDPMYLNYTLGKLMILKLRADWRAKVGGGGAFDLRAFHDRLLSYGDAPLPLIRRAMLGEDAGPPL